MEELELIGEVKVRDGSFGPISKEELEEAMWVDGNINEEWLQRVEQPENSNEHFSSILE